MKKHNNIIDMLKYEKKKLIQAGDVINIAPFIEKKNQEKQNNENNTQVVNNNLNNLVNFQQAQQKKRLQQQNDVIKQEELESETSNEQWKQQKVLTEITQQQIDEVEQQLDAFFNSVTDNYDRLKGIEYGKNKILQEASRQQTNYPQPLLTTVVCFLSDFEDFIADTLEILDMYQEKEDLPKDIFNKYIQDKEKMVQYLDTIRSQTNIEFNIIKQGKIDAKFIKPEPKIVAGFLAQLNIKSKLIMVYLLGRLTKYFDVVKRTIVTE